MDRVMDNLRERILKLNDQVFSDDEMGREFVTEILAHFDMQDRRICELESDMEKIADESFERGISIGKSMESPWVSVDERLPEEEEVVMWLTEDIKLPIECCSLDMIADTPEHAKVWIRHVSNWKGYWMPIPALVEQ